MTQNISEDTISFDIIYGIKELDEEMIGKIKELNMGYTSYDFYRQKYFGESVSETEFPKWNEKASDKLDFLTSGNIRKIGYAQLEEFAREQIQKAVCRLADEMRAIEKRTAEYDAEK